MSESNKKKQQKGDAANSVILGIIKECRNAGYIVSYQERFFTNYPKYPERRQFFAPFLIEFENGEKWIVFKSSSMRNDRVKEYFWDAEHLKQIDPTIKKAYLVYSPTIDQEERDSFQKLGNKITSKTIYSSLDGVYSSTAFRAKIKEIGSKGKSGGFMKNAEGIAFEQRLANSLSNEANLRILKGDSDGSIADNISLMELVLKKLAINPHEVERIEATADGKRIGMLPSGGKPKTDVLADVLFFGGSDNVLTISCKNSSAKRVSVAQFSADSICDAIDPLNSDLRILLNRFQAVGGPKSMSKVDAIALEKQLKPVLKRFCLWAIGGIGGPGDQKEQWAKYIMICHNEPDSYAFWTIDEYVDRLIACTKGHFGTPFEWTYARGCKGKSIQLKVKIID